MTTLNEAIQNQVRQILAERCQINISQNDTEQNIHLDSMALLELIVSLENAFHIKLDDSKLGDFYRSRNLDSITSLIIEQKAT